MRRYVIVLHVAVNYATVYHVTVTHYRNGVKMDSKQAHAIIATEKSAREIKRLAKLQDAERYRVYRVNPITSLLHQLPFVDIAETEKYDTRMYLVIERDCPFDEAKMAVEAARNGKVGVCIKSRWTAYLVKRLN